MRRETIAGVIELGERTSSVTPTLIIPAMLFLFVLLLIITEEGDH